MKPRTPTAPPHHSARRDTSFEKTLAIIGQATLIVAVPAAAFYVAANFKRGFLETPAGIVASIFIGLMVYFLPALIAAGRKTQRQGFIALLNLLTGWTLVGWVAAFIWACVDPVKR